MTDEKQTAVTPSENLTCYRCEAPLDDSDDRCPACGRSQFRVCFCGERIAKALEHCPHCNAHWPRRKRGGRHRRETKWRRVQKVSSRLFWGLLAGAVLGGIIEYVLHPISSWVTDEGDAAVAQTVPQAPPNDASGPSGMQLLTRKVGGFFKTMRQGAADFFERTQRHPTILVTAIAGLVAGLLWHSFRGTERSASRRSRRRVTSDE